MGRIGQDWVDNTMNERYGGQARDGDGDVIGVDVGEDMSVYITMGYGCQGGVMMLGDWIMVGGGGCVLVVGDKIDETCVWARKENWKNM